MVSKVDLALLAGGALAIFLVIRGAGKFFENFKFPDLLGGAGEALGGVGETIVNVFNQAGETVGEAGESVGDFGQNLGSNISQDQNAIFDFFSNTFGGLLDIFKTPGDPNFIPMDIPPAAKSGSLQEILANTIENFNVQSGISGQQFQGGGVSFIGGSVNPTPIENLSLSQIIDKFNVTASQAANIKSIAGNDFPSDFDFGTNTGSGVGSVISQIPNTQLPGGNVSQSEFMGLSPEDIFKQLVGGNISNF